MVLRLLDVFHLTRTPSESLQQCAALAKLCFSRSKPAGDCSLLVFPTIVQLATSPQVCVPLLLTGDEYDCLIIFESCNDLSNLPDNHPMSVLYLLSEASAQNTLRVAERALIDHKKLELVFILAAPPRVDSDLKRRLSEHRSSYLASLVPLSMLAPQIRHCPLLGLDERDLFARGGDGVHMHGVHARQIYTSAILAAVRKAFTFS